MKKVMLSLGVFLVVAVMAGADVYTYQVTVTNAQPIGYSDALPISGYLDKIEICQDSGATTTVTVATYISTTAVDTYFSAAIADTANTVARPRFIGTSSAAAALAAVNGTTNSCTTVLVAAYEKPMIGGNVKVAVTGTLNDGSNVVTVRIYYEPLKR